MLGAVGAEVVGPEGGPSSGWRRLPMSQLGFSKAPSDRWQTLRQNPFGFYLSRLGPLTPNRRCLPTGATGGG